MSDDNYLRVIDNRLIHNNKTNETTKLWFIYKSQKDKKYTCIIHPFIVFLNDKDKNKSHIRGEFISSIWFNLNLDIEMDFKFYIIESKYEYMSEYIQSLFYDFNSNTFEEEYNNDANNVDKELINHLYTFSNITNVYYFVLNKDFIKHYTYDLLEKYEGNNTSNTSIAINSLCDRCYIVFNTRLTINKNNNFVNTDNNNLYITTPFIKIDIL